MTRPRRRRPADMWPEAGPSTLARRADDWSVARKYAIVVDAGSSGSRMQVYSWKEPRVDRAQRERQGKKVKVLPTVEKGTRDDSGQDWQLKVEPGLSSFGSHPQDVDAYLRPLFDHARAIIPDEALADTPVYVLATAGMRLLPDSQRAQVLQRTCAYIQTQSPFRLGEGGCESHVQVISGEEEGMLGWIAINYLMDGFHFKATDGDGTVGKSTFGFLDMGGASTQIAFEPSTSAQISRPESKDDLTPVTLRMLDGTEVSHNVFVTTFLGFGTNRARDRYVEAMLAKSASTTVDDPCLPSGLTQKSPQHPTILGTGSFEKCLHSLAPLLDKDAACTRPPCLFHGVHVPSIDFSVNHFIGVSEYWFSSNDVFKLGGVYDYVSFQKAAQAFCGQSWAEMSTKMSSGTYGKQVTLDRLEMQCFKAAWMATVLHEGIGLPRLTDPGGEGEGRVHADDAQHKADAKNLFQSVNDVGGLSVSWTLGKAVLEASKDIPPAAAAAAVAPSNAGSATLWPSQAHTPPGFAVLALVVLSLLACLWCAVRRRRSTKGGKRRVTLCGLGKSSAAQGDYTLADMEEGGNEAVDSDEDSPTAFDPSHKRRRSSGNGLLAAVMVPIQRIGLALGFKRPITPPSLPPISLGPRRQLPPRYPMRHHVVTAPISMSQPTSPKAYSAHIANSVAVAGGSLSRPASRQGLSPRVLPQGGDAQGSYFAAPSSSLGSTTATATASARSSRAPSPVFGHSAANGRFSRSTSATGFSRKAWEDED